MIATSTRRLIASTWAGTDIADGEYADRLTEAIDAERVYVRESISRDEHGQISAHGYVTSYTDPATGDTRWVEYYYDNSGSEYADHDTREAAEAAYEENVRAMQTCVEGTFNTCGDGECWWDRSDVEGVPTGQN
jgi:hypothetical protein